MSRKSKGLNAERELVHLFWKSTWAAIRVAGSGSICYPTPDILAGNNHRNLAIECKTSKEKYVYIKKKQVDELRQFSIVFGAEPWIAVKFDRGVWYFLTLEDIVQTDNNFVVSEQTAKNRGLIFEEIIKN